MPIKRTRGPRNTDAAPPTNQPTDLPTEKITPKPNSSETPSRGRESSRESGTDRPARDLRALRAAERAARAAANPDSQPANPPPTPLATTTPTPPATTAPDATATPTPRRRPTRAARPAATPTPPPATPAATPTPEPVVATPTPATPTPAAPTLANLPPERIKPKPTASAGRTPTVTAERTTPTPERAQPKPAVTPERVQPKPTVTPERVQPKPPVTAEPTTRPRTATHHTNPTFRTLPGERITPRRPGERLRSDGGEGEARTFTESELKQEELERRQIQARYPGMHWYRMDLHCHTPRSTVCYREPNASYLRILQKAEERGVDIIAFTDHNTVAGYDDLMRDRAHVELMEREGRLTPDERYRLEEYRRIFSKMLILPGFEFSATFGFHIICIFPPAMSIRRMEHLLMSMGITEEKMVLGSPEVGATTDVLNVYRMVAAEGGTCIGAHANSSNGIVMNGFNFGGQTKIAYTQDPNLAALEVTDLDSASRRSTAGFFNGSKPEYPRRMHCIQSSDSHRIYRDPDEKQRILGVGDRTTDVLLPEQSFDALRALLFSEDFDRVRPSRQAEARPFDAVKAARAVGPNLVQSFHDRLPMRRMSSHHILRDMVAFANTNGGTIYLGVPPQANLPLRGVDNAAEVIDVLRGEMQRNITPPLAVGMEVRTSEGKNVVVVNVPKGTERPYVLEGSQIYIRQESDTNLAMREEIVQLVRDALAGSDGSVFAARAATPATPAPTATDGSPREERRFERRERYAPPPRRDEPTSALPVPPLVNREVDALATPPASIAQPAPQVEPGLTALAAPSVAAATIAAEANDSGIAHPEEGPQSAIAEEQTATDGPRRSRRRRRNRSGQLEPLAEGDTAPLELAEEPSSLELGEPMSVEVEPIGPDTVIEPPRTGVEVVSSEEREGITFHTMKDLRNGNLVHHVTRHSARRLWRYAITQREHNEPKPEQITWLGDIGLWRSTVRAEMRRYDLAQRDAQGRFHAYYGVTEDGLHGPWLAFASATPTEIGEDDTELAATPERVTPALPPPPVRDWPLTATDLANIAGFADLIERHFADMDDPQQRAIAITAHGHDLITAAPQPSLTWEQVLAERSPFEEAKRREEAIVAHTAAEEPTLVREFIAFEQPAYVLPEEIGDYIVVVDSGDLPEVFSISDDGAPPLDEARAAWSIALPEPQAGKGRRGGRGKQADAATPVAEEQPPVIEATPAPTAPPSVGKGRTRKRSSPQPTADPTSEVVPPAPQPSQPRGGRNRKPAAPIAEATPVEAPPSTPPPATPRSGRRRNGPSDLRRGRDEDPANPDIAPIPQLASRIEPYDERD